MKFWLIPWLIYGFNPDLAKPGYILTLQTEANWSGSALFVIKYMKFINNLDQVIWLAEN